MPADAALHYRETRRSSQMLTIGDVVPDFRLPALAGSVGHGWEFDSGWTRGRWVALLYWPTQASLDSSHEIVELLAACPALVDRETQLIAACAAIDADRWARPHERRLTSELPFPVLVDVRGELAGALGIEATVYHRAARATFVADPAGVIRWVGLSELPAARSIQEAASVLQLLRGGPPPTSRPSHPHLVRACAWCRRLQDEGAWHAPEAYIRRRLGAELTHGICQDCLHQQSPR